MDAMVSKEPLHARRSRQHLALGHHAAAPQSRRGFGGDGASGTPRVHADQSGPESALHDRHALRRVAVYPARRGRPRAQAHRSFALRFIIEGHGAFTAVGGEKVTMERGDVVLTPTWEFHDHGNESNEQMIWLDGLDLPLLHLMPVNFGQQYKDWQYPSTPAVGASHLRYPWLQMQARLDAAGGTYAAIHVCPPYDRGSDHRDDGCELRCASRAVRRAAACAKRRAGSITSTKAAARRRLVIKRSRGSGATRSASRCGRRTNTVPMKKTYLFRFDDRPLLRRDELVQTAKRRSPRRAARSDFLAGLGATTVARRSRDHGDRLDRRRAPFSGPAKPSDALRRRRASARSTQANELARNARAHVS